MHYVLIMKCPQTSSYMDQSLPNFLLGKLGILFNVTMDQFQEVTFACELHDYVKNGCMMVIKCLLEVHNMFPSMGGQKSNLIKGIISIFFLDPGHSNLYKVGNTFFMA